MESHQYLWYQDPDGGMWLHEPHGNRPQYFRVILAEALGTPELADWRKADPDEDRRRVEATVGKLKPFFR
jgi:hypothetical protein